MSICEDRQKIHNGNLNLMNVGIIALAMMDYDMNNSEYRIPGPFLKLTKKYYIQ